MPRYHILRLHPCNALPLLTHLPQLFFFRNISLEGLTYAELHALSCSSPTMATKIDNATVTGADVHNTAPFRRLGGSHVNLNGFKAPQPLAPIRTHMKKKYRHVAAVHSKPRTSCLSHDSQVSPSFLGFRNLMVIVLGIVTTSEAPGIESNSSLSCRKPTSDD